MMINQLKTFSFLGILTVVISPALVGFSRLPAHSPIPSNSTQISLQFPRAENRGAPRVTSGGGTRGDESACVSVKAGEMSLTAFMPDGSNTGKTAIVTPTLYWYVPQTTAIKGEFILLDEDNNEVYQTLFDLPNKAGIVKLSLPTKANLEPGKRYTWSFAMICDSQYRNRDVYIEGTLDVADETELTSDVKNLVNKNPSLEKAELYANSKIWVDTLDTMFQLRNEEPTEWKEFLESVGLGALAETNFADCCTVGAGL